MFLIFSEINGKTLLVDGKNDNFLCSSLTEATSLIDYADDNVLMEYDLSTLVEGTIRSTPSIKVNI